CGRARCLWGWLSGLLISSVRHPFSPFCATPREFCGWETRRRGPRDEESARKIAHARALASAFFFLGVAKVPFFKGFPLRAADAAARGRERRGGRVHRHGARNAAILVAESALSPCSASA